MTTLNDFYEAMSAFERSPVAQPVTAAEPLSAGTTFPIADGRRTANGSMLLNDIRFPNQRRTVVIDAGLVAGLGFEHFRGRTITVNAPVELYHNPRTGADVPEYHVYRDDQYKLYPPIPPALRQGAVYGSQQQVLPFTPGPSTMPVQPMVPARPPQRTIELFDGEIDGKLRFRWNEIQIASRNFGRPVTLVQWNNSKRKGQDPAQPDYLLAILAKEPAAVTMEDVRELTGTVVGHLSWAESKIGTMYLKGYYEGDFCVAFKVSDQEREANPAAPAYRLMVHVPALDGQVAVNVPASQEVVAIGATVTDDDYNF